MVHQREAQSCWDSPAPEILFNLHWFHLQLEATRIDGHFHSSCTFAHVLTVY
jgi:hypothetical protein